MAATALAAAALLQGARSAAAEREAPTLHGLVHWGVGVGYAENWSPVTDKVRFGQASLLAVFDRDPLFPYRPSPSMRWMAEADGGLTETPQNKGVVSAGVHALWSPWRPEGWRPFVSGGIGGIYTDFQVEGQPLRVNFNPQVGLGAEVDGRWLFTVRVHHLSNAGTVPPNRGVNSVLGMLAVYLQ